ncbi:hypothetical protein C8J57DRAFT_1518207 [Mycena rebaudengoi]|nr:hypothetical protein C8J57DRAFT_1518207 [Mycena rebaudengoi]
MLPLNFNRILPTVLLALTCASGINAAATLRPIGGLAPRQGDSNSPSSSISATPVAPSPGPADPLPSPTQFLPCSEVKQVPLDGPFDCEQYAINATGSVEAWLNSNPQLYYYGGCDAVVAGGVYCSNAAMPQLSTEPETPLPSNVAVGTKAEECAKFAMVGSGTSCTTFLMDNILSLFNLRFMNPDVDEECTNLVPHTSYCVQFIAGSDVVNSTYIGPE